ncbi:MAG: hypothetical protein CM1200mP10_07770 [Candidatus Neomarinimicrobiota bacterium]|nr:MAG: hypothetical protein CM1200mP10_07770 [Candidatus Neomarinimicrobiota bacterium]
MLFILLIRGHILGDASNYYNVAAGPTNNLLAYGKPMTLNLGVQIDF